MAKVVNNEMLQLAREARALTQKELALRTSISQGHISKFESGQLQVPKEQLERIGLALDFPPQFFFQPDHPYGLGISFVYHRKRKSLPVSEQKRIQAQINVLTLQITRLLRGVDIECDNEFLVLDIGDFDGDAESIAQLVRAKWNLPLGPVNDLIGAIESAGGVIVRRDFLSRKFDAQSRWLNSLPPMFFVNHDVPTDRLRFTLAHEIGHIVMHRIPTEDLESEADRFASEFLMPRDEILPDLSPFSLQRAAMLKPKWRVSIASLVRRAFYLGVITHSQYRRYFTQLSAAGHRTREPITISDEQPSLVTQLLEVYQRDHGYTIAELCQMLYINEREFRSQYLSMPPLRLRS